MRHLHIWLLEDDPLNAELVCELLSAAGHEVRHAGNAAGFRALALETPPPDLALMDILIPDGDGAALLEELRRGGHLDAIPVLALTAKAEPHEAARFRQAGFINVLIKPIDTRSFVSAIEIAATKGD